MKANKSSSIKGTSALTGKKHALPSDDEDNFDFDEVAGTGTTSARIGREGVPMKVVTVANKRGTVGVYTLLKCIH